MAAQRPVGFTRWRLSVLIGARVRNLRYFDKSAAAPLSLISRDLRAAGSHEMRVAPGPTASFSDLEFGRRGVVGENA